MRESDALRTGFFRASESLDGKRRLVLATSAVTFSYDINPHLSFSVLPFQEWLWPLWFLSWL